MSLLHFIVYLVLFCNVLWNICVSICAALRLDLAFSCFTNFIFYISRAFSANTTGTTKIKHVDDNVGSLKVKLTAEDLKEITDAVAINEVAGSRNSAEMESHSSRFVNTPAKNGNVSVQDS